MHVQLLTLDFVRLGVNRLDTAESAKQISALVGKTLATTKPVADTINFLG